MTDTRETSESTTIPPYVPVRLQANVDHVATLRQARGSSYPDPVRAARMCEAAGANGITIHLREDRRHIQVEDVLRLRAAIATRMNLEISMDQEVVSIAESVKPDMVTLVPERREERTTEGGLDAKIHRNRIAEVQGRLQDMGVLVSLFLAPEVPQMEAAADLRADMVELHTGEYAHAFGTASESEQLGRLAASASACLAAGIPVAAGHGLTQQNVKRLVTEVVEVEELNIGHAMICDAVFLGLAEAVRSYREAIAEGVAHRSLRNT